MVKAYNEGGWILNIINPHYKLREQNIFSIRDQEYAALLETVRQILIPAEELGFELTDCRIKDSRFSTGEISRTLKQNLVIRLQKGASKIDLSMQIPKLVDGNYIIINGRKKIPQFQLFDIPVVTRGKSIKIRTNVATIMIIEQKEAPFTYISILGRKVPLFLVIFGYYGIEPVAQRFNLPTLQVSDTNLDTMYDRLLYDMKMFYDSSRGTTQDDIIKEIGRYYSKYNARVKGEDLMYALDLILDTDVMSACFFRTGSILEEILDVMQNGPLDDTLITNKRIRCFEYVILAKVSKAVFDLCMSNRTARQPKFNVNSTAILSECNVSDIVQFDFSINPIDELTKLSRTSLVGPGGFNRQNVPEHLRDIMPTMFGRLCPVDTPDRDNCGVLQNLVPNAILDDNLKFSEEYLEKQPISIAVSMVPFLEHDDQTRLQMSASQMRQSIMLKNFDQPMIQSGCEGLYTDKTQFVKVAKKNGEVVHLDHNYLILLYDDKTVDIFDISYRKIYISNLDVYKVYVQQGDKVKAGDILAESYFTDNGKINIGKNLLTAVAEYYGYNYEDGIVLSDRVVKEGMFTSVHFIDLSFTLPPNKVLLSLSQDEYKPLPGVRERVSKGEPYMITKEMPSIQMDYKSIFKKERPVLAKSDMIITEVNMFANSWNKEIPQFDKWMEKKLTQQQKQEEKIANIVGEYLSKEDTTRFVRDHDLAKYGNIGKYKFKGEYINGVRVEMFGIFFRPIQIGDKIGNRHGNKGVVSTIVPQEKMPQLPDGRHVDICINPLGIISRMNIGQVYELHLGMALYDLRETLKAILDGREKNSAELDDAKRQELAKRFLLGFIELVDKTDEHWYYDQYVEHLPETIDEKFIDNIVLLQPPFESMNMSEMKEALEYTGTKFEYPLFEPMAGQNIQNEIAVGYLYFFKMVHIAETRLAARGIGSYTRKTLQPLAGRKNRGGQRMGEMETGCLIGHDAPVNLAECLTTKSDCTDKKNQYIRDEIDTGMKLEEEGDNVAESVKLLKAYLTTIGVRM